MLTRWQARVSGRFAAATVHPTGPQAGCALILAVLTGQNENWRIRAHEHVTRWIFRHKKRRPWTSFFVELVGRGNLNGIHNKLIYKVNIRFVFLLEYLLEYLHQRLIRIRLAEVMLPVELEDHVAEVALLGGHVYTPARIALRLAQGECISFLRAFVETVGEGRGFSER